MKRNSIQHTHHLFIRHRRAVSAAIAVFILLLHLPARALLTPEDLSAIRETGLTALTGEQEGEYPARDYVVVETMKIPKGDTVTFMAGSRIFFHRNARITVFGTLQMLGVPRKKCTLGKMPFSLPKLSSDRKLVFDSTSIYTYSHSQLTLRHTIIADSSVKIRLTDTTSAFIFDTITCADNHFLFPDTALYLPSKSVLTCSMIPGTPFIPCKPVLADTLKMYPGRFAFTVNPLIPVRIVLGVGVAGAAGVWYYFNSKGLRAETNYSKSRDSNEAKSIREHQDDLILYRNLAAAGGACCLAGLSITFLFGGHDK